MADDADTAQQQVPVSQGRLPRGVYVLASILFAMDGAQFPRPGRAGNRRRPEDQLVLRRRTMGRSVLGW
ncbi:hypothetical protein [Nonomuraea zeae]|uniref:hypothetical protein n=1 Tax=Nonomuraea zeae TaxID=1642303 RepID=UPI0014784007|nr:hypothetical protein [Nonomuraea zeae]